MRRIMTTVVAAAGFLAVGSPQAAIAQYSYEWHRDGQPVTGSIQVTEGGTFSLQVYLREQTGGTALRDERLVSAGVRVRYDNPTGVVSVPNTSSISVNPLLSSFFTPSVSNPNYAQFFAGVGVTDPGVSPDANNRIWLGTFTFQVASGVGSTQTLITATDIPPPSDDTFTGTGRRLDELIADAPLTILVSPVPEPATVTLFGATTLLSIHALRRIRKHRRQAG